MEEVLGERKITLVRELTKKYETAFRTTFSEAITYYSQQEPKGECVIVIEGKSYEVIEQEGREQWMSLSVLEHMEVYLGKGMDKKEAMKAVSADRGVSKRDIYQMLLEMKE